MTLRTMIISGAAAAALAFTGGIAFAQDNAAEPPAAPAEDAAAPAEGAAAPAEDAAAPIAEEGAAELANLQQVDPDRRPEDNWLKVCEEPREDGTRACIMRQVHIANGQFLGSFLLRDDPSQESRLMAIAAMPLGVLLPLGVTLQIDNGQPNPLPFVTCNEQRCESRFYINEAYVNSLKRGATLRMTAKNLQNKDLTIEIDLAGFTAVYDGEAALSYEEYRDVETGAAALEQILQDRAEQIRREKEAEEAAASGEAAGESEPEAVAN